MKSKVVQWILHKVLKTDQKVTNGYSTDGPTLHELLKHTTPMKPDLDTAEKLFNVSVETSNEDLVIRTSVVACNTYRMVSILSRTA